MTESELQTRSSEYNAVTNVTMGYQEIRNSAENWQTIMRLFREGRAKDLSAEPKKLLKPVVLTGSGPGLDKSIGKLRNWTGDIICHFSQALTLMRYGIEPDYIMALDSICNWEGLQGVDWSKTKTKLILHPGMWPSLVENWPNEMLFFRQNLGKADSFGVNEQKIMYCERLGTLEDALASKISFKPLIATEMMMFAHTPAAQLFAADVLQYGPVFLVGLDFCYIDNKERFTDWSIENGEWKENIRLLPPEKTEYVYTDNGLPTDRIHLYYKKNFISACRLSMQQVYTTDHGAINYNEIPYADIDKVLESGGKRVDKIAPEVRARNYERYLAKVGCFVIVFEKGMRFVEVNNPIPDITSFIVNANRQYVCPVCGNHSASGDNKDYTGYECQACKKGRLRRSGYADLKENINRIQSHIDFNKAGK